MKPNTVEHATFTIERRFRAPPRRVFAAWAEAEKKRRWMVCHDDWVTVEHQLDFRIGGTETNRVQPPRASIHTAYARFIDIVPERRIVYCYEMLAGEVLISASLVSVMFEPFQGGTQQSFTEQVTFLDGHGNCDERRAGTEELLTRLGTVVG